MSWNLSLLGATLLILTHSPVAAPEAVGQTPEEAFRQSASDGAPNPQQWVATCLKSPTPKLAYTSEMAPLGTAVPLRATLNLTPLGFAVIRVQGAVFMVSEDVVVDGRVILKRGTPVSARYVGTSCIPSVSLALGSDPESPAPARMANVLQWIALSFRDPRDPAGSDVVRVSTPACFGRSVDLTGYISGPPSVATVRAAMAHVKSLAHAPPGGNPIFGAPR